MLQKACQGKLEWDDDLKNKHGIGSEWDAWLKALPQLKGISIAKSFTIMGRTTAPSKLRACAVAQLAYNPRAVA